MNIKKRHITSCFPPSQGGLGWVFSCLFLMFFVMPSCQEDEIPHDTTEVMMTFTTRAFVEATQGDTVSTHLNEEKMKDLRVIMVRENGEIVGNHKEQGINQTSVTFTFRTPVQTGGEDFTFFAIANEGSITSANDEYWNREEGDSYSSDELNSFKALKIGNSAFTLSESQPIPQTKQWIIKVPQQDTKIDNQRLEYVASKISVEFRNETNKPQTLKNIKLTGIAKPTSGYLFKQDANDFVGTQQGASDIVLKENMTLATEAIDSVKYYTYPVNGISNAQMVATWEGVGEKTLALDGITSLPRNQQLKIIVTLTGQELTVNYTIAPWTEHTTSIGGTSPTPEGGYDVKDWDSGNDVVIGEEQGGGEEPEPEPVEPGDVIWSKDLNLKLSNGIKTHDDDLSEADLSNFIVGNIFGIVVECLDNVDWSGFRVMQRNSTWKDLPSAAAKYAASSRFDVTEDCVIEFTLAQGDIEYILQNKGVDFWGNGVTITQIYIKAPAT